MHKKNGTRINGKRPEMREAIAVERTLDLGSRKAQEISERVVPTKERLKGSERLEEEQRERRDEISKEGEDDEVEMRDFSKTGEEKGPDKKMEGLRRSKDDQTQTSGKDVSL